MKNGKRILKVTVKRMIDDNPDTSWLGEYSNHATSEFSIDRKHSLDCPINTPNKGAIALIERIRAHVTNGNIEWVWRPEEVLDDTYQTLEECEEAIKECDCDERGDMERNEYRYFNPSFNYVDKAGHALAENTAEEVRKYVRQDYERMEAANRGDWCFLGIRAEAEIGIGDVSQYPKKFDVTCQTITSGGIWGMESDAPACGFEEEEQNQLAELRDQLKALGFSSRAISKAFETIKRKEE